MKKLIATAFLIAFFLLPVQVKAVDVPAFSACTAPTGEVIANYSEGIHGIVGESAQYSGHDTVYKMNEWQIVQCFCPKDEGQGIQTVWWKYTNLSETDVTVLTKQGWIHVANGKLWGLDDANYLTKNTRFNCKNGSGTGTGTSTGIGGEILSITDFAATGSQQVFVMTGMILCGIALAVLLKKAK